ncbi:hypothetical protein [Noviherbaspirillum pedocola]|uniref:Uncharacterized protein n=1 Tax=Noviherbaspirillum pedocola TaxID=2801341 RepID=A0A934SUJ6_9BURK|nr:hypothetical protein [Noviherbaspirillum pedocola]MBK4735982.1 hypothetical protein [Noviherbaspirillum pedocola]
MDFVEIGPTPSEENCEQCGTATYCPSRARTECAVFANQIRRHYGEPPEGASIRTKGNRCDAGTYYEVAIDYSDAAGCDYAFSVEGDTKGALVRWDAEALNELRTHGLLAAA